LLNFYNAGYLPIEPYAAFTRQVPRPKPATHSPGWLRWPLRALAWLIGLGQLRPWPPCWWWRGLAMAYPNLPDVSDLADYRPKLPLRVYSTEGALLGEFGEERRNLTPIKTSPVMTNAVLAIEDARFFEHGGVDYKGVLRAALANLGRQEPGRVHHHHAGGAQRLPVFGKDLHPQDLRNIADLQTRASADQGPDSRDLHEPDFLGNRAYGFAAASEAYFGKPLKDITIAEAAMLAGLPKAPSAYNPISNPKRARIRQLYIIERMEENGFITAEQAAAAKQKT
jgi:penicillin-binding protein 1A